MSYRRFFPALALAAWIIALGAGTSANLSWIAPTTYSDGSTLPATDIALYTIQWTGGNAQVHTQIVNAPALAAVVNVPCGSASFSVTVTTTATAAYPNATSVPAGPVPYATGVTCQPNPVSGLTVN
jgi:hypothetical protein